MSELGFKQLTIDNWLTPDQVSSIFARFDSEGNTHEISGEEWLQDILKPQLLDTVPKDVKALFEVSRSAMAYGYFFYPLYTLACEQLYRVIESAVSYKCKLLGAPPKIMGNFEAKIKFLIENSVISEAEKLRWDGIRGLRNIASHPEMQSLGLPTNALSTLERSTSIINLLFEDKINGNN